MGALTLMVSAPGQTQTEAAKAPAPTLHSSSQVSDAPGKGILPMISGHMAAGLSLYHLDGQPIEQVSPWIQRQYLHGSQSTFTKWISHVRQTFSMIGWSTSDAASNVKISA